jgi:heme/copper-type cytochrome/quinol oxidase subunit 2
VAGLASAARALLSFRPCFEALLNVVLQIRMVRITIHSSVAKPAPSHKELSMSVHHLARRWLLAFACAGLVGGVAQAADAEIPLVIKNHRFEPAEIKVPAGQRVKLMVHNQDTTPEEFESHALNREKVIPAGAKAAIFIGPLKAGRYAFYGEYNEATAKGVVIAE